MKLLWLLPALVLLSNPARAEVEKNVDRFDGSTRVRTKDRGYARPFLSLSYWREPDDVEAFFASITYFPTNGWKYSHCHTVYLVVDGKPSGEISQKYHSRSRGLAAEFIELKLNYQQIKAMSVARKIETRICTTEFTLTDEEMRDMRDFVRLVEETKTSATK